MDANNVGENRPKSNGRFVKGDPRCWRKGRPKSFDQLRALAQTLANEPALDEHGQQIVMDGHVVTNAEMLMRAMMKENPERFVEISYGKVPQPIDLKVTDGDIDSTIEQELARVAAARKAKDAGTAASDGTKSGGAQ